MHENEEKESIKNAIIMEEMYKQGFKDGINLIMQCQKSPRGYFGWSYVNK